MRRRDFWLLAGSFAVCGATTVGLISVHLIPASVEHGIPEVTAAGMLAAMGLFDLVGTTFSGWLTDRIDARKLLVWYYTLRGLALLFLPAAYDMGVPALAAFVVFYGLTGSRRSRPRCAWSPIGSARSASGRSLAGFAAHQFGGSLAAFGAGATAQRLWHHLAAFVTAGLAVSAGGAAGAYLGGRPGERLGAATRSGPARSRLSQAPMGRGQTAPTRQVGRF